LKDIIIEGVDRLGKDSLIQGIQDHFGFFQEIHYQKPKQLNYYFSRENAKDPATAMRETLKAYQRESFVSMFRMLTLPGRHIMNRAHLGEDVYAPRYRKYDGSYVFDLERQFTNDHGSKFADTTLLVLLTTSDFSFIKDDGQSFDFSKKEEEQEDFKRAFNKSTIKNKLMIDVSLNGSYKSKLAILADVIDAYMLTSPNLQYLQM
jgi:hypothetical protein